MKCRTFKKLFSAYIDGELDGSEKAECETHLEQCVICARFLAVYRQGVSGFTSFEPLEAPANLLDRVLEAVGVPVARGAGSLRFNMPQLWVPVAATAAVLVGMAMTLFNEGSITGPGSLDRLAAADPTMDVVTVQMLNERPSRRGNDEVKAHLATFETTVQNSRSGRSDYGDSNNPVFIRSGVYQSGE